MGNSDIQIRASKSQFETNQGILNSGFLATEQPVALKATNQQIRHFLGEKLGIDENSDITGFYKDTVSPAKESGKYIQHISLNHKYVDHSYEGVVYDWNS